MFVSPAFAQTGAGPGGGDALMQMLPLVLIFVVFYFLLIRPQQQKMKRHREVLAGLRRGDRVVTGGGLIGTVVKVVNDNEVTVEIAEGVRVRIVRSTISEVLAKTEPVSGGGKPSEESASEAADAPADKPSGIKRLFGGKN